MARKKIGIIGCGTIGSSLAKAVSRGLSGQATLAFISEHRPEKAEKLKRKLHSGVQIVSMAELVRRSDIIVEAASAAAAAEVLKLNLKSGQDVLIMSVGGLLKVKNPLAVLKNKKARFWIPSGALCGIDGLLGSAQAGLKSVKIVTRKPPQGLNQAPHFQKHKFPELRGNEEKRVFVGSALEAVKSFPQNINVAAVLSLAGLGARKTRVEIWTSNAYRSNRHEVFIRSGAGEIHTLTNNVPSRENPKTSAMAIYSAIAILEKIFSTVRIGT